MNVLITGSNRGIGLEFARQYARDGHRILACCRDPESAEDLQILAKSSSGAVTTHALDVSSARSVAALKDQLKGTSLDLLINNAGVKGGDHQALGDMDYEDWAQTFAVNALAPLRVIEALADNLSLGKKPKIITISSQMGSLQRKAPGMYAYRSSKAAVNKIMQLVALDLAPRNIIACPVHPGWVKTDMGGPHAEITVGESVSGLRGLIDKLTMADTGKFFQWNGQEHPW